MLQDFIHKYYNVRLVKTFEEAMNETVTSERFTLFFEILNSGDQHTGIIDGCGNFWWVLT